MATKPPSQSPGFTIKIPETLTLKDLITIVSVAVSLTIAWGVFSTRITLLEKEHLNLKDQVEQVREDSDKMKQQIRRLEAHQQDDELLLDQVYSILKRPPPRRSAQ